MKLNINISTDKYCHVLIEDLSTYQDETNIKSINPSKLKFSDTVSIISIIHSDTREDKLKYQYINQHTKKTFKLPINFDGVFTVKYIVLPTKAWYDRVLKSVSKQDLLEAFKGKIYVCDNESIIEIIADSEEYISISEFIESEYQDNLSVSVKEQQLLSICKLHKCYVNLCQQIFENRNFAPCWSKNKIDSNLIYKRDLVWMTINVITYLWKKGDNLQEIQRILSQINTCNGLCDPYPNTNSIGKTNGCGCSSK